MEQAASSPAGDATVVDPLAGGAGATGAMHRVRIEGLSVGLVLLADEYLITLGQELGMIRLDHRPAAPDVGETLDLVDSILAAYASARDVTRRQAEVAYDAGRATFDVELELPEVAAAAAVALARAIGEIQELSRQGKILLPPLDAAAAEHLTAF